MGEVHRQVGQRVEQGDVVAAGFARFGAVGVVEFGDAGQRGRLLGLQLVVGAAQCFGERVVGVAVLGLPRTEFCRRDLVCPLLAFIGLGCRWVLALYP